MRHLTFGVDPESLKSVPSVAPAVRTFVREVSTIPGARPVTSKLDAHMFEPQVVPEAKVAIESALENLVNSVRELEEVAGLN